MIYCSDCGTANRLGSKFCNECGALLPEAAPAASEPIALEDDILPIEEAGEADPREWIARALAGLPRGVHPGPEPGPGPEGEGISGEEGREAGPQPGEIADVWEAVVPAELAVPAFAAIASPAGFGDTLTAAQTPSVYGPLPGGWAILMQRLARLGGEGRLVYLAILAAVLVPLLIPTGLSARLLPAAPEVAAVHQALTELPPGTPVLVAAEYEPAFTPELDPLAVTVMDDALGHGLHLLMVSTLPEGPALARQALAGARQDYPGIADGQQVANLGYLPGGQLALRAFAAGPLASTRVEYNSGLPLETLWVTGGIGQASDFGLIIVVSGRPELVRSWIEQVGSWPGVRLAAAVSAAAEPQLRPYLASGQLVGLVSGQAGGAQLERLAGRPGRATAGLDALSSGIVALLALIVLGSVLGARGSRKS